jgi:hypothetical protein
VDELSASDGNRCAAQRAGFSGTETDLIGEQLHSFPHRSLKLLATFSALLA